MNDFPVTNESLKNKLNEIKQLIQEFKKITQQMIEIKFYRNFLGLEIPLQSSETFISPKRRN